MAPSQRNRLVRRTPLIERIKSYLDPLDFLLWLSEEINSTEWEDSLNQWSLPAGIVLNVTFMLARANATSSSHDGNEDVFSDDGKRRGSGWLAWFASALVFILALSSIINGFYTFWRKRHYRLFEVSVDSTPSSISASRVRVDSSPVSSSPLRYMSKLLNVTSAGSRAHPDPTRDVWELAVWDPTPIALQIFCSFSPGHVLIYCLFLPLAPLDPRPSVTVAKTVFLATLLSIQLSLLRKFYTQQAKDSALVHSQVQNEYDTKFVRPQSNRPVRDVGTQCISKQTPKLPEVLVSTPTNYVNRGFQPNPNSNYARHYDPDSREDPHRARRVVTTPNLRRHDIHNSTGYTSPYRDSPGDNDEGGSFGGYDNARSPLKKAALLSNASKARLPTGAAGYRERPTVENFSSPLRRSSTPGEARLNGDGALQNRFTKLRDAQKRYS